MRVSAAAKTIGAQREPGPSGGHAAIAEVLDCLPFWILSWTLRPGSVT